MPEVILSDYFYGQESEEFIYFKIPRLLITDQKFKHVSTDAKLLYGMLLDRMGLSAKNSWYDDYGRVYIYYTVDEICGDMVCGRDKAMKLLAELEGDEKTGVQIVARALTAPVKQIAANAGIDGAVVLSKIQESGKVGYGFDAYKEEYCDMISAGIVDPTKVTRTALENAASIASVLLTTEALVADKPEPPAPAPAAPDMGGMY